MPDAPTLATRRADAWTSLGVALLVSIVGTLMAWLALDRPGPGIDDAYITLVYGRNLADGHGFVYTPGGERVEGSTSLAWTFVVAAVCLFTKAPEKPLMLVALLLTALTLVCACRALRTLTAESSFRQRGWFLAIVLGWMLFHPGFWAWNVLSLMENPLWSFTVAFTLAELAQGVAAQEPPSGHRARLALIALLGALTRPEWLVLFPALLISAVFVAHKSVPLREAVLRYLPPFGIFLIAIGAVIGGRLWYFGYPFPNTYYVKTGQDLSYQVVQGLRYLALFLVNRPWNAVLVGLLAVIVLSRLRRLLQGGLAKPERSLIMLAAALTIGLFLPVPNGGDAFADFRFYQPFVPFLIAPVVHLGFGSGSAERLRQRFASVAARAAAAFCTLTLLAAIWTLFHRKRYMLAGEFRAAEIGQRVGADLSRAFRDLAPSVGVVAAGGIAWSYRGRVVDLLGLNWVAMAHSNGDRRGMRHGHGAFSPEVFWSSPPDLLVVDLHLEQPAGPVCDARTTEALLATPVVDSLLRGLPRSERFSNEYEPACLGVGTTSVAAYVSQRFRRPTPSDEYRALRRD